MLPFVKIYSEQQNNNARKNQKTVRAQAMRAFRQRQRIESVLRLKSEVQCSDKGSKKVDPSFPSLEWGDKEPTGINPPYEGNHASPLRHTQRNGPERTTPVLEELQAPASLYLWRAAEGCFDPHATVYLGNAGL